MVGSPPTALSPKPSLLPLTFAALALVLVVAWFLVTAVQILGDKYQGKIPLPRIPTYQAKDNTAN